MGGGATTAGFTGDVCVRMQRAELPSRPPVVPAAAATPESPSDADVPAASFNGYSLVHWTDRGLSYWAVSDAAALERAAVQRAFVAGAGP